MQPIRTQPAGPKAFRLYSMVQETYRQALGERALAVYAALTYYVHPKTLAGAIPLKLLAQTTHCSPATVRRALATLAQQGLISITPQWDVYECVPQANIYTLHRVPVPVRPPRPPLPRHRQLALVRSRPRRSSLVSMCRARQETVRAWPTPPERRPAGLL